MTRKNQNPESIFEWIVIILIAFFAIWGVVSFATYLGEHSWEERRKEWEEEVWEEVEEEDCLEEHNLVICQDTGHVIEEDMTHKVIEVFEGMLSTWEDIYYYCEEQPYDRIESDYYGTRYFLEKVEVDSEGNLFKPGIFEINEDYLK